MTTPHDGQQIDLDEQVTKLGEVRRALKSAANAEKDRHGDSAAAIGQLAEELDDIIRRLGSELTVMKTDQ